MTQKEKLDILKDNLNEFGTRREISDRQRILTLSEIAKTICENEESDIAVLYSQFVKISADEPDGRMIFCKELLQKRRSSVEFKRIIAVGDSDGVSAGAHGRIAYPKNKFNDEAFERLSSGIRGARAFHTPTINGACEQVADGTCEFCILPIENSIEGKLFSFYSLLDRFELKICAACYIDTDSDSHIRYALISRGCREPSERALRSTHFILDFSLLETENISLKALLEVAELCGAELLSIDTRPVPYDTQSKKFILSFRIFGNQGLLFRILLSLNYDSYSPIGFYPDVKK